MAFLGPLNGNLTPKFGGKVASQANSLSEDRSAFTVGDVSSLKDSLERGCLGDVPEYEENLILIDWSDVDGVLAIKSPGQGLGMVNLVHRWNPSEKLQ